MDKDYESAWSEGEDAKPAPVVADEPMVDDAPVQSAVQVAARESADADAKAFSDAFNAETSPVADSNVKPVDLAPAEPAKPKTFKASFAQARKDGLKVFEWNGKKYTTDVAKAKAKAESAKPTPSQMEGAVKPAKPEPKGSWMNGKEQKSIYDGSVSDTLPAAVKEAVKRNGERKTPFIDTEQLQPQNQKGMEFLRK